MKNATRVLASTIGAFMALGGIEHGIGEILQGPVAPDGLMILSWPRSEFFQSLGGEPAMTVIPNMLVTGVLAILVSTAMLSWSVLFIHRKHGGLIMILLSIAALLVGGGIFPPVFGILIGAIATKIHSPLTWWRTHLSTGIRRFLAKLWPWSYGICVTAWLCVLPGVPLMETVFGVYSLTVTLAIMCIALGTFLLTIFAGFAHDSQMRVGERSNAPETAHLGGASSAKRPSPV